MDKKDEKARKEALKQLEKARLASLKQMEKDRRDAEKAAAKEEARLLKERKEADKKAKKLGLSPAASPAIPRAPVPAPAEPVSPVKRVSTSSITRSQPSPLYKEEAPPTPGSGSASITKKPSYVWAEAPPPKSLSRVHGVWMSPALGYFITSHLFINHNNSE